MINKLKIDQVIIAINSNELSAFNDEELAKLLSILNPMEYDYLEKEAYRTLGGAVAYNRLRRVRSLVEIKQKKNIHEFKMSQLFEKFLSSLKNKTYLNFLKELSVTELARIKEYCVMTVKSDQRNIDATNKLIKIITQEIAIKEANKNLTF